MEVIYKYKTIDGKEFFDKTEALEHENIVLQEEIEKIKKQTPLSRLNLSDIKKELLSKIPEIPGVYMLVNPYENYKKYIGSTNNLRARYQQFLTNTISYGGTKINQARQNIDPCRWQHIILETCESTNLITRENFYISTFDSIKNGYNGTIPSENHKKNFKDKDYKAAESAWKNLMDSIHLSQRKGELHFNYSFTKEEYVEKRVEYRKKYPKQELQHNFKLNDIDKDYTKEPLTIDNVVFIPSKIAHLLGMRRKYQQSGLLTGVLYSKTRNQYTYTKAKKEEWYNTELEAHEKYMETLLNKLKQCTNDFVEDMDETIVNVLKKLTVEQLGKLILLE